MEEVCEVVEERRGMEVSGDGRDSQPWEGWLFGDGEGGLGGSFVKIIPIII
jgi:hypothetical protein